MPSPEAIGYPAAPVDDLLVFHIVFGKTVPDISLNAVANLGYADGRFLTPVFPGDTLSTTLGGDRAEADLGRAMPASSMSARSAATSTARSC